MTQDAQREPYEFGAIVDTYRAAGKAVWNNPAVWITERDSADSRLLAWPRGVEGTAYQQFLAVLFNADVEIILYVLQLRDHPALPALPPDIHDPKFQVVLRVMHRASEAGRSAVEKEFEGVVRPTGLREFRNDFTAGLVEMIERSGMRRELGDAAFAAFGISRSAAYRAMKKKPRKR